ncbi:hypothetical protein [Ideonella sp.]|uniref:hypothetical protein n=1 Tax=Ideonella sp. TaxID=1929293 RepID=UPI003BB56FEC
MRHESQGRQGWVRALLGAALACGLSACAQEGGEDPANQYHRYSNEQLEAVCLAMSPSWHVSGLTDGAWGSFPGGGRTYYYRSACFMELARRTGNAAWCDRVLQRRSLLGDGSAVSPASCQAMVAQGQALQAMLQQSAAAHAAAVQGAFVLGQPQVQPLPGGGWRISVDLQGTRPGRYRLELDRLNARKRLRTEAWTLTQGQTLQTQQWDLSREEVVGTTPLPAIFPLAISLFYLMPEEPTGASDPVAAKPLEHLGSVQNLTLSAQ